jgi:Chromosome segregation ATPases
MADIQIDPEIKSLIRPLSEEERCQLRANLLLEGCRDPLVTWRGILLDGHNRFEICSAVDIAYSICDLSDKLATREEAIDWVLANQLGRRNLTAEEISYYRGLRYNREKRAQGRPTPVEAGEEKFRHSDGIILSETADRLALEHGVSPRTIERDGRFAKAVEAIGSKSPEAKQEILAGGEFTKEEVMALAKDAGLLDELVQDKEKAIADLREKLESLKREKFREEQQRLAAQERANLAESVISAKERQIKQLEWQLKGHPSISDAAFAFLEATVGHWQAHQEVYDAILTGKVQLAPQAVPWAEDVIALGGALERALPEKSTGRLFYATANQTDAGIYVGKEG